MSQARHYVNPYLAGAALGLVLFLSFYITGNGLGASGALYRMIVKVEDVIVPSHVDQTPYLAKVASGDKEPLDHWLVWETLGILLGGFVSGSISRRLKVETRKGPNISTRKRLVLAFVGGSLMGFGARFARGCTSGQALSGGAVLSVGSWAFMLAVFAGGYFLAWFVRKLWN